jgi:hypothetical protein
VAAEDYFCRLTPSSLFALASAASPLPCPCSGGTLSCRARCRWDKCIGQVVRRFLCSPGKRYPNPRRSGGRSPAPCRNFSLLRSFSAAHQKSTPKNRHVRYLGSIGWFGAYRAGKYPGCRGSNMAARRPFHSAICRARVPILRHRRARNIPKRLTTRPACAATKVRFSPRLVASLGAPRLPVACSSG